MLSETSSHMNTIHPRGGPINAVMHLIRDVDMCHHKGQIVETRDLPDSTCPLLTADLFDSPAEAELTRYHQLRPGRLRENRDRCALL